MPTECTTFNLIRVAKISFVFVYKSLSISNTDIYIKDMHMGYLLCDTQSLCLCCIHSNVINSYLLKEYSWLWKSTSLIYNSHTSQKILHVKTGYTIRNFVILMTGLIQGKFKTRSSIDEKLSNHDMRKIRLMIV